MTGGAQKFTEQSEPNSGRARSVINSAAGNNSTDPLVSEPRNLAGVGVQPCSPAPAFIPPALADSGVTVNIRWGHLDQMPRCKACGKVICSHFDANWQAGVPHNPDATS